MRDKSAFRRGVARLKAIGCDVEVDASALASHMRFAGDDAMRLAAIGRAAASGADVALISRGGYGLTRILADLPYKAIAKAVERGTAFVGLSDFTAFQQAVLTKTGGITWAGPAVGEDFGTEDAPDDIMQACFEDLLAGHAEGVGWRWPAADRRAAEDAASMRVATKSRAKNDHSTPAHGDLSLKNAVLWGGNLAVLTSMLGSPWFPQIKGGVLFLEDVHEHPYRIERMLTQLLHAGVLAQQKAVVLGQFSNYKLVPHDKGFKLATVLAWLRQQVKTPILTGLPFGHVPTKVLLPVGARVSLEAADSEAFLLWEPVR